MSREEIHKLLGGYATDTLTNAERKALFEAAMEDQDLFDSLAAEQPLRELLQDDRARRELLAVLEPAKQPAPKRWVFSHAWMAAAASVCVAVIALGLVWRMQPPRQHVAFVAQAPLADRVLPPPVALPEVSERADPQRSQDLSRRKSAPARLTVVPPAARSDEAETMAVRPQSPPAPVMAGAQAAPEMRLVEPSSEAKKEGEEDRKVELVFRSQAAQETAQVGKANIPLQAKFFAQRYRLFKKDSAGVFQETAPDVARGDTILFEVTPSRDGQLTVSMFGDKDVQTVFVGLVNAGVPYRVPLGGLVIAGEPGTRTFSIRWSTTPRDIRVVQQSFKDKSSVQITGAYGQRSEPDEIKLVMTVR